MSFNRGDFVICKNIKSVGRVGRWRLIERGKVYIVAEAHGQRVSLTIRDWDVFNSGSFAPAKIYRDPNNASLWIKVLTRQLSFFDKVWWIQPDGSIGEVRPETMVAPVIPLEIVSPSRYIDPENNEWREANYQ